MSHAAVAHGAVGLRLRSVSDPSRDVYAFYRYHVDDPVFFHEDCRVTIQQMGNASSAKVREMQAMIDTLRHLADACCGDHRPDCPILADLGQGTEPGPVGKSIQTAKATAPQLSAFR